MTADLPLPEDALPAAFEVIRGVSQITPGQLLRALTAAAPALRAQGAAAERDRIRRELSQRQAVLAYVTTSRHVNAVLVRDIEHVLAGDAP